MQDELIEFPEMAAEIEAMANVDQDMRKKGIADPEYWDESVDKNNTLQMKQIVSQIGWPTRSKVGEKASSNAWLLVQHADHDVEFQKECLLLMQKLPSSEVRLHDIAYLTDRICVNSKELQIYGTQFNEVNGQLVPREIKDIENVNQRRKEIGLNTLEEYTSEMHSKYKVKT